MSASSSKAVRFFRVLPFVLLALTLALQIWIFSNSVKSGKESSEQSAKVVKIVKPVYEEALPKFHVNPTYENISHYVRKSAHFVEFFSLGALSILTVWFFKPAGKKRWLYLLAPLLCGLTAMADECIQLFSENRGPQWSDVLLDFTGSLIGMFLTLLIALLVRAIIKTVKKHSRRTPEGPAASA